jgi:hypothetical protein
MSAAPIRPLRAALLSVALTTWASTTEARTWTVEPADRPLRPAGALASIQEAIALAAPGDEIEVGSGLYQEQLRTVRAGTTEHSIIVRARDGARSVTVTWPGRVLTVNHSFITVSGLVLDGQYGQDDTVRLGPAAHGFNLLASEVRRSSRDLIDMGGVHDVLIADCFLHHALNPLDGRSDAHGIVAGPVQHLVVRDTEIHTFSGDGVQVDAGRSSPGWTDVTLERMRIWLEPLPQTENGFAQGTVPGENAVDTKASGGYPRARITILDSTAWGFRNGISNMAAFNLKENVEAVVDRVTVFDSEIAFRLRGGTPGAWVTITNALVHSVNVAFRYEDAIERLRISHATLGAGIERAFLAAQSSTQGLDVRNVLVLGPLPQEAIDRSNQSVDARAFVDAAQHDYHLTRDSPAVDTGTTDEVATDRDGVSRPQGPAPDVGAYERAGAAASGGTGRRR